MAEMIPFEPDADNAAAGKSSGYFLYFNILGALIKLQILHQMIIQWNDSPMNLEQEKTLAEVLLKKGFAETKGIAVAINGTVIPKKIWQSTQLNDNDSVLVIRATQGG